MFAVETKKPLHAPGSVSYLPNNLSGTGTGNLTFAKVNDVFVLKPNGESVRLAISRCKVYQSKFIQLQNRMALVVMSDVGVQVWTADGDNMLFYYAISSLMGSQQEDSRFMRGAAGVGNFLCVGCSTGAITVFDCTGDLARGNYPLVHTLEAKGEAIYELSSSASFLTAGDDCGNLFAYRADSAFELSMSIRGNGCPCTSIVNTEYVIVAGFTSGHIRVYRLDTSEMAVEITAHVRSLTGLALCDELQLVASCAGDQLVHVWSVPNFRTKANSSMDCVFSHQLENKVCTGAAFLNSHKFAVAAYDDDEITVFNRV